MKQIATTTIMFTAVASMAAGSLWPDQGPDDHSTQIATGGYFYGYNDANDGGSSPFTWPNGVDEYEAPGLNSNGSLSIEFALGAGFDYPFAAMGVDMVKDQADVVDVSTKTGFCVTYASQATGMQFEVKSPAYGSSNYDTYLMNMPNTNGIFTVMDLPFASLKQGGWGTATAIADVKAAVSALAFKFSGTKWSQNRFSVLQLGYAGECAGGGGKDQMLGDPGPVIVCGGDSVVVDGHCVSAIQSISLSSTIKAQLSGKVLSFTGLGNVTLSVQIVNLQGQVYQSAIVTSAKPNLNLALLPAGIYVIRATGANSQIHQRIVIE